MKILITGATGFIGRHLARRLAARHEIVAVARRPDHDQPHIAWIREDLATPFDTSAWPTDVDTVIHLAQSRRYRDFPDGAADVMAVNVDATRRLLDYARTNGVTRFLFTSSGGIYGHHHERMSEAHPLRPLDFYLGSKHLAELLVAAYRPHLAAMVLRPFFVYGPGQTGLLFSRLLDRVLNDQPITIDQDPGIRINPIYIDDFVTAAERALELREPIVLNVCGDEPIDIRGLVETMGRLAGRTPDIQPGAAAATADLLGDNQLMKTRLGIRPRVTLEQGLRAMIEPLVQEHPA